MATSADSPTAGEARRDPSDAPETAPETNFPEPAPVDPEAEKEQAGSDRDPATPAGEAGEIWATWTGQQPGERVLTVADLKTLGWKDAEEPLVWNRENRWVREVTDVHPMVLRYIEETDKDFKVERF